MPSCARTDSTCSWRAPVRPAAAPAIWWRGDGLAHEHRRLEVDLHDLVERGLADVGMALLALDADAVDEDVEAAEATRDRIDGGADAGGRMGVHREADRVVAGGAERGGERFGLRDAASGDGDARTGEGEAPGDRFADAAVAAGDEGGAAAQARLAGEQAGVVGTVVLRARSICRPACTRATDSRSLQAPHDRASVVPPAPVTSAALPSRAKVMCRARSCARTGRASGT